jgi:hypothetical protein
MSMETASNKPAKRSRQADLKRSYFKSRVSTGRDILPDCDGRSTVARRYRDIASQILADQGGEAVCSETRQQLIRRFSAAAVIAEQMESALANGEAINVTEHCQLSSTMVRIAHRIGVDRIPRDITDDAVDQALLEELGQ